MSYWSIVKEKDINGEFEIFDNLHIPLKRREYRNNHPAASIKKLTILNYANTFKIIVELDSQIAVKALETLYIRVAQLFPAGVKTFQQYCVFLTVEENEMSREQISVFLDYLHYEVESIEPKVVRDDMKTYLGFKRIRDDEDVYREIIDMVKNKEIHASKLLAEQAFQKGYNCAFYYLGVTLYYSSEFKEAFEALKKVPDDPVYEQDYCQANELLAKLVLNENVRDLEETRRYVLAFKYANKAKGLETAVMLREELFMKLEQLLIIAKQKKPALGARQSDLQTRLTPYFNRLKTMNVDLETVPRRLDSMSSDKDEPVHFPPIHKVPLCDTVETFNPELIRKKH